MMGDIFYLSTKEVKPLFEAMSGKPYFLIVDTEEDAFLANVKEGFDVGHIFKWLANYAKEDKEFKAALADFIIDLSKEC